MKKRMLLSLLAIAIFSFATTFNSFGQESKKIKSKQVGAAVIDFLLRNPKTANKMKPHERTALDIIGDLLKTQDQREHELEYATAGKSQLTINTTDGRQAQFVKDGSGNIFLVVDGVIHPIAQELINQASNIPSIENAILPPYNLTNLESRFYSTPKEDISQNYRVQKGGEYLSDIAKKFDVPASNIFYRGYLDPDAPPWKKNFGILEWRPITEKKKIWENRKKIKRRKNLWIVKEKYKNQISAIFSYKWHRDLDNDGTLGFNEFNQIKRTFYNDEDFYIAVKYQIEKGFKGNIELKFLEDYTGELIEEQNMIITSTGSRLLQQNIPAGLLPVGLYLIHANLINDDSNTVSSKSERFEIIQKTSKTKK